MKRLNNNIALLFFSTMYIFSMHAASSLAGPFPTLKSVQEYAHMYPEYPELSAGDWSNPDFTKFYKEQGAPWWKRWFMTITFRKPLWDIRQFKTLLLEQIRQRKLNGFRGDFVQKINPSTKNKFILWGDLHGAFHSLVRDLNELHSQGVIDQNFKIRKDYYFIFNGNAIDNSPYSLVTLTLILRVMTVNPKRCIYIRGDHEDRQKWENYSLARELKVKGQSVSSQLIPLSKELTDFFNSLPLALYLCDLKADAVNVVQISRIDLDDARLNKKKYAAFLAEPPSKNQPDIFKPGQQFKAKIPVDLKAIISGEDRTVKYHPGKGLVLIARENKAPVWALLSSPIGMHRALYAYFYDSFVELNIMPNINNWTLTLFNQDVREMLGFKKRVVYKLVSGERVISDKQLSTQSKMELCATEQKELAQLKTEYAKLEKQVKTLQGKTKEVSGKKVEKEIPTKKEVKEKTSQKDIQVKEVKTESAKAKPEKVEKTQGIQKVVFGSCTDLRSGSSEFVLFSRGLKLRFDQARQEGSINGIMPQLILKNDFFRAKKTREIVDAYIKQGINKIIAITGAGPTNAVLDLVKNKKILLLFPSTGLPEARSPEYTNLVLYRTDDIIEGRVMVNYAVEKLKTKSGVLLVQDDHFGHSLLLGIKPMLKKLGVEKKWTTILNEPRKTKLDKQVEQIKKIKPDTIIFCGPISVAMAVIRQIGIDKLAKVKLIGNSDFASEAMQKFVKDKGLTLINPVLVPNPKTSDLEIVRQFRKAAKKANIPYDVFALESYITADITFDILKKIKGKVTNEKIMKVIENIKNYDYKGFKLNFNPQNRQIAQMMWIDTGSSDKWEPVSINKFL